MGNDTTQLHRFSLRFWYLKLLLAGIHTGLLLVGYSRMVEGLSRLARKRPPTSMTSPHVLKAELDRTAGSRPFRTGCLQVALALHFRLARRSIPSCIRFGVPRRDSRHLRAHAWVEINGHPVHERPELSFRFAPLE